VVDQEKSLYAYDDDDACHGHEWRGGDGGDEWLMVELDWRLQGIVRY